MMDGKKTYTLAIAAVLAGVAGYLQGHLDLQQALEAVWAGGAAAALRHGLAKTGLQ